ncbi:MAG: hypothetical protein J1E36_06635 [Eubacterium sp.]|nr:hypothetical protein [Eubacterium sp.]
MTSHQFSASKYAAKYDFKRALKSIIVPSVLTFLASVFYFVISPLNVVSMYTDIKGNLNLQEIRKNFALCLTNQTYSSMAESEAIGVLFLCLGVLFALFSFSYITKKRNVNVYFSLSIDRRTMFKNRTLTSVLMMGAALLLPIIADIIMNIHFFQNAGYVIKYGLLLFAECYVYALAGFSLMLIGISYCTTIVESIFFTGAVAAAPTAAVFFVHYLCAEFLRGYNYDDSFMGYYYSSFTQPSLLHQTSIINPLILGKAYGANYTVSDNLISFGFHITKNSSFSDYYYGYSEQLNNYTGYENAPFNYILPVIVWAALSVCFIFIARQVFIKIKAEDAGVHGTRPIATNFFAVEFIMLLFAGYISIYASSVTTTSQALIFAIGAVAMFIWYFIILAICKRTIKRKVKELIVPLTTIGITLIFSIILMNGGFGFSTYVPDPENVSKAIITATDTDFSSGEFFSSPDSEFYGDIFSSSYRDNVIAVFTDEEDLKALTEINAKLAQTTDNMTGNSVCVYYELKNGKTVSRYYDTTDYDAQYSVLSLRDSKAAHDYLTYLLTGDSKEQPLTNLLKDSSINVHSVLTYDNSESSLPEVFQKGNIWVIDSDNMMTYESIKNTPEFREALLKDLLSQTYEQRFKPAEQSVGGILFSRDYYTDDYDYDDYDDFDYYEDDYDFSYYESGYYIYPSMTNTINYLKSTGEYALFAPTPDEIESISIDTVKSIRKKQFGLFDGNSYTPHQFISLRQAYYDPADYYDDYDEYYDYYDDYYYDDMADYFENTKTFTDEKQINELLDKSKPYYFAGNDDCVIMIKYKKAGKVTRLISANDVPKWAIVATAIDQQTA